MVHSQSDWRHFCRATRLFFMAAFSSGDGWNFSHNWKRHWFQLQIRFRYVHLELATAASERNGFARMQQRNNTNNPLQTFQNHDTATPRKHEWVFNPHVKIYINDKHIYSNDSCLNIMDSNLAKSSIMLCGLAYSRKWSILDDSNGINHLPTGDFFRPQ